MLNTTQTIKYGIIISVCMILGVALSSCNREPKYTDNVIESEFFPISINKVYDSNTLVVYYGYNLNMKNGYLAPYYSENGKLCRYMDGQIVEIDQEDGDED